MMMMMMMMMMMKDISSESVFNILKTYITFTMSYLFCQFYPYRILIIESSRSGKTFLMSLKSLFNVICHQPSIDKIYV